MKNRKDYFNTTLTTMMRKQLTQLLAIALVFAMVLTMIPVNALAVGLDDKDIVKDNVNDVEQGYEEKDESICWMHEDAHSNELICCDYTHSTIIGAGKDMGGSDNEFEQFMNEVTRLKENDKTDEFFGSIILALGNTSFLVDGVSKVASAGNGIGPIYNEDQLMIPLLAIIDESGGAINIDADQQKITITEHGRTIELSIDSDIMLVNDVEVYLETAPRLMDNTIMVPVEVLCEGLCFEYCEFHDDEEQYVILTRLCQTKRLFVQTSVEVDFTELGAIEVIKGPDNNIVIQFATMWATKEAQRQLDEWSDVILVRPDIYMPAIPDNTNDFMPVLPAGASLGGVTRYDTSNLFLGTGTANLYIRCADLCAPGATIALALASAGIGLANPIAGLVIALGAASLQAVCNGYGVIIPIVHIVWVPIAPVIWDVRPQQAPLPGRLTLSINTPGTVSIVSGSRQEVRFTAPSAGTYVFESFNRGPLDPKAYTGRTGTGYLDDDGGESLNYRFERTMSSGQTFTFYSGVYGDSSSANGSYNLAVTKIPAASRVLQINTYVTATVNSGARQQLSFTAPSNGRYRFESSNRGALDPAAYANRIGGSYINDDGAGDLNYRFDITMTSGQTLIYYTGVYYDNNVSGNYSVIVTRLPVGITWNYNGGTGSPSFANLTSGVSFGASIPTPNPRTVTIMWNANGGSVSPNSSAIPVTFSGWYTSITGGSQITSSSIVPSVDTTYYARWSFPALGTLPTPEREGYRFDGWFTSQTGGAQITSSSITPATNTTYYASWTEIPPVVEPPALSVSSVKGITGEEVTLTITLENNPGITAMMFDVNFDDTALRITETNANMRTALLNGWNSQTSAVGSPSPVRFSWRDGLAEENNDNDGIVVNLKFEVITTVAGIYPVTITLFDDYITNAALREVKFNANEGCVEVVDFICGDVNSDGRVNFTDATLTERFAAGWDSVNIDLRAADVNGDQRINFTDATIIERHAAGWSGYEVLPILELPTQGSGFAVLTSALGSIINMGPTIAGVPAVVIDDVHGSVGTTVEVPIRLVNNPGITAMMFDISFDDSALRLAETNINMRTSLLNGWNAQTSAIGRPSPVRFSWRDGLAEVDNDSDGVIVILIFEIITDEPGVYPITVTLFRDFITNAALDEVYFAVENGSIIVEPPPCNHIEGDGIVTKPATCEEKGEKTFTCTKCGVVLQVDDIDALGHDYNRFVETIAATCIAQGYTTYECERCEALKDDDFTDIDPDAHDFAYNETIPPTCVDEGYDLYVCSRCEATEKRNPVPPTSDTHSFTVYDETVDATCVAQGYTVYKCEHCTVKENRDFTPIDPDAHTFIFSITVDPTCEEAGYDLFECDDCRTEEAQNTVPALGHAYQWVLVRSATCKAEGEEAYECSHCFDIKNTRSTSVIACIPGDPITTEAPTCSKPGTWEIRCVMCEDLLDTGTIPVTPCTPGEQVTTVFPTCVEEGAWEVRCTECRTPLSSGKIGKIDHSFTIYIATIDATCVEPGYTTYKCEWCEETDDCEYAPPLGVDFTVEIEREDATCLADGYAVYECSRCDESHRVILLALGHTYSTEIGREDATCELDGYVLNECVRCDEVERVTLPALGHDWMTVETPPAIGVEGAKVSTCMREGCGETRTEIIPALESSSNNTSGGAILFTPSTEIEIEELINPPYSGLVSFTAFINGYTDNTFRGAKTMSREEFVNIIYKLKNVIDLPKADVSNPTFNDVAPGRWSYDAIEWAVDKGIIEVDTSGSFRPKDALTRAEMAVMLARTEGWTEMAENTFSDIDDHPHYQEILLSAHAGVFEGNPDGTFRPDDPIRRYELVAALIRYLLGGEPADEMWEDINVSFTDVQRTHWAYKYLALATEGYSAPLPE